MLQNRDGNLRREDVTLLAQLLTAMKESVDEMEKSYKRKDMEKLKLAKKEVLDLQSKINGLL